MFINGQVTPYTNDRGYVTIERAWKKGDVVTWNMAMPTELLESNPLVEENRNQVAVKRGPMVYCLESPDMPAATRVFDVALPSSAAFKPVTTKLDNTTLTALETNGLLINDKNWDKQLYRPLSQAKKTIPLKLIPYYAWANRGQSEMTIWVPVVR